MKNIYVGNLPWSANDEELRELFAAFGSVSSARVITDRETGRSRGFGFVEMDDGAEEAIAELNGHELDSRPLRVSEARGRDQQGPRAGTIDSWATYDGSLTPSVRKASTVVHHGGIMDWWGSGGVTGGPTSVVTTPSR